MATDLATMSEADKAAAYEALMAGKQQQGARFKVIVSNAGAGDRVLFSSVSENRAKQWIVDHCPRGSHFFLRTPDGSELSYEAERTGLQGADADPWAEFDRDAYQAPTLAPITQNDPWADAWEGAQ